MIPDWIICWFFGHDDTVYGDVEARAPGATYRYCHRCGRQDPPRPGM